MFLKDDFPLQTVMILVLTMGSLTRQDFLCLPLKQVQYQGEREGVSSCGERVSSCDCHLCLHHSTSWQRGPLVGVNSFVSCLFIALLGVGLSIDIFALHCLYAICFVIKDLPFVSSTLWLLTSIVVLPQPLESACNCFWLWSLA